MASAESMNQEREHIRLLAIFHWVVAAFAGLFSLFPVLQAPWDRVNTLRSVLATGTLVLEAVALSLRAASAR